MVDVDVEVVAVDVPLADQLRVIGFVDGALERFPFPDVLAADVDVGRDRVHGAARDDAAFQKRVGIVP